MERIQIFKVSRFYIFLSLFFGAFFFVAGLVLFVHSCQVGFDSNFFGGDWNYVVITFQGLVFIGLGIYHKRNNKFFVEWNNEVLRYHLPGEKHDICIRFSELVDVAILHGEARLVLPKGVYVIGFANLQYKHVQMVKNMLLKINPTSNAGSVK